MSLVSIDDRAYQPRVLPNVFSDMPSQAELAAAKRARGSLMVLVILLAGMLIAAAVALYVLWNDAGTPNQRIADLERQLTQRNAEITALQERVTQYQSEYGAYSRIHQQRSAGTRLRSEIAAVVTNRPWTRTAAGNFEQSVWGAEEARLIRALEGEADRLSVLKSRLERMPQPITGPAAAPGQIGGTP